LNYGTKPAETQYHPVSAAAKIMDYLIHREIMYELTGDCVI